MPQAHAERVRKLLPALLGVQGGAGSGGSLAACCFLLPMLSQVRAVELGDSSAESYTSACDSNACMQTQAAAAAGPLAVVISRIHGICQIAGGRTSSKPGGWVGWQQ